MQFIHDLWEDSAALTMDRAVDRAGVQGRIPVDLDGLRAGRSGHLDETGGGLNRRARPDAQKQVAVLQSAESIGEGLLREHLTKPDDAGAHQPAVLGGDRHLIKGKFIEILFDAGFRASPAMDRAVNLNHRSRARTLVQPVHILGDDGHRAVARTQMPLKFGQRVVSGVGLHIPGLRKAPVVPAGDQFGVAVEGVDRGQFHRVVLGPVAFLGVAEGGESALGGDARAGEDDDGAGVVQPGGDAMDRFVRVHIGAYATHMKRVFLRAEWRDLILANYAVDPVLLEPRLPPGLEPDRFEGQAVCSLVGFRFLHTRVLGVKWPGFVNFPEINLRFYVRERESGRRGVVFVRELVTSRFVASVARGLYNEPYSKARISDRIEERDDERRVEYRFEIGGSTGRIGVRAEAEAFVPPEDSTEHWFKEHQWGYGTTRSGRLLRYEVHHPIWACHRVRDWSIEVDWGRIYGEAWGPMNDAQPLSVMLAQGSAISVGKALVGKSRSLPVAAGTARSVLACTSHDREGVASSGSASPQQGRLVLE